MTNYIRLPSTQALELRPDPERSFIGFAKKTSDQHEPERANWSTQMREFGAWSVTTTIKDAEASTYRTVLEGLARISRVYTLRASEQVIGYLQQYTSLLAVLEAATPYLHKAFGERVCVALEVNEDPETGLRQLAAMIQTHDAPERALAQLNQFDHDWWLDQLSTVQGSLLFHVEYA